MQNSKYNQMLKSPESKVLVKIKSKYIKDFDKITKMSAIQNAATVHLEDLVNITGEVVSMPVRIKRDRVYDGFSTKDIQVGDTAIFSFSVIYDFIQKEPDDPLIYKNRIFYHGQEYWQADIRKIFGVIRNGEIIMVNGYVMAGLFDEDKIYIANASSRAKNCKSSQVIHIGNNKEGQSKIPVHSGDTIFYNPLKPQKYQINNKPFIILQQNQVLGVLKK